MSLKAFHVIFVLVSFMLFAFLAYWAFFYSNDMSSGIRIMGVAAVIGLFLTPIYGVVFYKKIKSSH